MHREGYSFPRWSRHCGIFPSEVSVRESIHSEEEIVKYLLLYEWKVYYHRSFRLWREEIRIIDKYGDKLLRYVLTDPGEKVIPLVKDQLAKEDISTDDQ